jgi:hypothetical protein
VRSTFRSTSPNWAYWTPVTEFEWRGFLTVSRLLTLRAYGRLAG